MSERASNILIAMVMVALAATLITMVVTNPTPANRVARIGASIMCPVCQGESIGSSPAPMARDMMALVEERVAQGASNNEIIDELLTSYSGAILLDPPVSGPTIVLWVAPAVALLSGIGVIVWWRRHPGTEAGEVAQVDGKSRIRRAVGAVALITAFAGVVVAVGFFLQDRAGPGGGVADLAVDSLDEVSNETLEAVIAANLTDPRIGGMRLALADRYFEDGDYRAAFPHYLAVAESADATGPQVVAALTGLGWMTWDGNREAETAIALFDEALAIDPDSVPVRYLKSKVLWCGLESPGEAETILTFLLAGSSLPDEWRAVIQRDIDTIGRGEPCQ
jgi:cytochrome c-type biogenesis protein CcmH